MENEVQNIKPAYVSFVPKEGGVYVHWKISSYKKWIGDKWTCFIPAFNIYFSAKDQDGIDKKTKTLARMYVDNYMLVAHGGGIGHFVRQLNKLGFRAPDGNAMILKSVLKDKKLPKAKFRSMSILPESFNNAEVDEMVGDLEMAY